MKSLFKSFLSVGIAALLFASCQNKSGSGDMIPSDAFVVAHFNTKSMLAKLPWSEVKEAGWYKEAYKEASMEEWRKKLMDDPASSGIDFDEGITFFVAGRPGGSMYAALEGKIKNEADFEAFNKSLAPSPAVSKEGDINTLVLKYKNVAGWNKDHFVYVLAQDAPNQSFSSDSALQNTNSDWTTASVATCKKLFSLKRDSSLASNSKFGALMSSQGDVLTWVNTESMVKNSPSMGLLGMLKMDALIKDNFSTYIVNFDNGKISVDQKGYVSKELGEVFKKYMGASINMDMIKNIPSQDVVGLLACNFKPQGIIEILKLIGADGMVNMYTQQLGITADDLSKATNGDILIAATDFSIKKDTFQNSKPDLNFIFSTGIGDKASLQKIIDATKRVSSMAQQDTSVNYVMNDKVLAVSNSLPFANKYLAGNNSRYDFTEKFAGHPGGFFLDIRKILSGIASLDRGSEGKKQMMDRSIAMWDNLIGYGGDFSNSYYTSHADINLVNKDTNSLKQLNSYLNDMYNFSQAERNKISESGLDSLLTPPPIDTVRPK